MDYPFYEKCIGDIDDGLLNDLIELSRPLTYVPSRDFEGETITIAGVHPARPEILRLIQHRVLTAWFEPSGLRRVTVDLIKSKRYLPEHSDLTSRVNSQDFHKIHIPLITNDAVGMLWKIPSPTGTKAHVMHMHAGGVFLYNNFAHHAVVNMGPTDRYHLILRYNLGSEVHPDLKQWTEQSYKPPVKVDGLD